MNKNIISSLKLDEPWTRPWPVNGLESLSHCPVCDKQERVMLHSDLVDDTFRVAPGKWTLWQCAKCSCAYLDVRPTQATIHLAYANYYTHQESVGKDNYESLSSYRRLRRRLTNGYTNWRYSTHNAPSSTLGIVATLLMPTRKKKLDRQYRHLPILPKDGGVLLDVGCGDGAFLNLARTCGWNVVGLDPDPKAVFNAKSQGLLVYEGGIDHFEGQSDLFDVITLNHVIEHVHDPVATLKACHTLLKPGGQLWLETPNINSFGHIRFQKKWRGLEAPRHLTLFSLRSLQYGFAKAGFEIVHDLSSQYACMGMFKVSSNLQYGDRAKPSKFVGLQGMLAVIFGAFIPERREFLTMISQKIKSKV